MRYAFALLVLVVGCIAPSTERCNELICPVERVCDPHRTTCVLPSQVDVCDGQADGAPCTFPGEDLGVCDHGVCHSAFCGDGFESEGEICDDANSIDGDGCSAQCRSNETCGNNIVDVAVGENCDDGNFLSGDGCSSRCGAEIASWHEVDLDTFAGSQGPELAYDAARERVVLFGGLTPTLGAQNATLEYDGVQWNGIARGARPPGREAHVFVYDPMQRALLAFGGNTGMTRRGDTWRFDGAWRELTPAPAPSARAGAGGASTPTGALLFGGETDAGLSDETWRFVDGNWQRVEHVGPSARRDHRMAYDSIRGRVVLFGGRSGTTLLDDTWEHDGTGWSRVTTATTIPTARGAMVFDAARGTMLLFGGRDTRDGSTWAFDGTDWRLVTATGPTSRRRTSMAYDATRGHVVLRGGTIRDPNAGGPTLDDTWIFDGAWRVATELEPHAPLQRNFAGWAWDPIRSRFALAAGFIPPNGHRSDTWTYDGSQWVQRTTVPALAACNPGPCTSAMVHDPTLARMILVRTNGAEIETWLSNGESWTRAVTMMAPPARRNFSIAYDRERGVTVFFGGTTGMAVFGDTWEFDGATWSQRMPAASPSARSEVAMAFDQLRGQVVLFGGRGEMNTRTNDTWMYDGTTWTELATEQRPPERFGASIAYHAARGRLILFGGEAPPNPFADTWELGPTGWEQLVVFEGPGPRKSPHLAYDEARKLVVLHGGDPQQDTWELLFRSTLGDEVCDGGVDDDNDALADCADPDCDDSACGTGNRTCRGGTCECVAATETRCGDRFDDDCDGQTDCDDTECTASALCQPEALCGDSTDNDGDGAADCADPGCAGVGTCEAYETSCGDSIDNDADGRPDCDDPDCFLVFCSVVP